MLNIYKQQQTTKKYFLINIYLLLSWKMVKYGYKKECDNKKLRSYNDD